MAAKKSEQTIGQQMTAAALKGVKELEKFLDANPIEIFAKGTSREAGDQPKSTTARNCVVQSAVPTDVYVNVVTRASQFPGAMKDGNVAEGFLPRAVREALLPVYAPNITDISAWEDARAETSSHARGQRMREQQAEVKAVKNTLAKIHEQAATNPELAAMLAALDITP